MNRKKLLNIAGISTSLLLTALASSQAFADTYEVKLTNVTASFLFTPRITATHAAGKMFTLGKPAIPELIAVAEAGELPPFMALLESFSSTQMVVGDGMLSPGASQTVMIEGTPGTKISMAFMLLPSNDAFSGLNGVTLPLSGSMIWEAPVYDAGSETNDELCSNIPGPQCGGTGQSPDDSGEGFIHIHPGIHGTADISRAEYSWHNPAAIITVTKL